MIRGCSFLSQIFVLQNVLFNYPIAFPLYQIQKVDTTANPAIFPTRNVAGLLEYVSRLLSRPSALFAPL